MKYSVIVPVYKVEQYLARCVQSVKEQTCTDYELILVDDGSPDGCPQLCDAYAQQDARIRVIHKTNGGLSDARNAGMREAQGEYLVFLDSDDYLRTQDALEQLLPYTEQLPDIIACDAAVENGNGDLVHSGCPVGKLCTGPELLRIAIEQNSMSMIAWLNLYKRSFMETQNLQFKKGILHEDEQFTPRAFLKANTAVYADVKFYQYVIREDSITTQKDLRRNMHDLLETIGELEEIYRGLPDEALRQLLLDGLTQKYLDLFQRGHLQRYGKQYLHKDLVRRNAFLKKTKSKAALFCFSPRLYYQVNLWSKRIRQFRA